MLFHSTLDFDRWDRRRHVSLQHLMQQLYLREAVALHELRDLIVSPKPREKQMGWTGSETEGGLYTYSILYIVYSNYCTCFINVSVLCCEVDAWRTSEGCSLWKISSNLGPAALELFFSSVPVVWAPCTSATARKNTVPGGASNQLEKKHPHFCNTKCCTFSQRFLLTQTFFTTQLQRSCYLMTPPKTAKAMTRSWERLICELDSEHCTVSGYTSWLDSHWRAIWSHVLGRKGRKHRHSAAGSSWRSANLGKQKIKGQIFQPPPTSDWFSRGANLFKPIRKSYWPIRVEGMSQEGHVANQIKGISTSLSQLRFGLHLSGFSGENHAIHVSKQFNSMIFYNF